MKNIYDENIKVEDQRTAFCECCKQNTFQKLELWNPDHPEYGNIWICRVCQEPMDVE